jgi:hypothetical protein
MRASVLPVFVAATFASPVAVADDEPAQATGAWRGWHPSVETDPTTIADWVLGSLAYSTHVLLKPPIAHWRFGLDNYEGDVPAQFLKGDASPFRARYAAWGAQAQFFFSGNSRGFFVGSFVIVHRWTYRLPDASTSTWRAGVTPELGFQWLPFGGTGWYVTPWIGATMDARVSGSPQVGGHTYPESAVSPIITLHVGYEL